MLQKGIVGNHKAQRQSVAGWAVASHDEGRAKELVDELIQEGVIDPTVADTATTSDWRVSIGPFNT